MTGYILRHTTSEWKNPNNINKLKNIVYQYDRIIYLCKCLFESSFKKMSFVFVRTQANGYIYGHGIDSIFFNTNSL